jgi:predicted nuclease with TOPRIM domain
MQFDNLIPQNRAQWFGLTIATILAAISGWITRRKREPIEIDKLRAETKSIHITAENAQVGVGMEAFREMQAVILKAEQRREEWHAKEEQLRTQIVFWRNNCEELDGKLAEAQEAIWKLESENSSYAQQIKQMHATLILEDKNYDNTKHLPVRGSEKPKE